MPNATRAMPRSAGAAPDSWSPKSPRAVVTMPPKSGVVVVTKITSFQGLARETHGNAAHHSDREHHEDGHDGILGSCGPDQDTNALNTVHSRTRSRQAATTPA